MEMYFCNRLLKLLLRAYYVNRIYKMFVFKFVGQ